MAVPQADRSSERIPRERCPAGGTAIGRRGRVYVSQLDDDLWSGGDTVTGGRCEDAHVHIGYEALRSLERALFQRTLVFAY